ncbi:MAG: large conductance mechanosensitive channel protein MscL [Clostridia bacterium]|nr:large conductance mechanosensitive channel protein MscL [Clostridia bacterium]
MKGKIRNFFAEFKKFITRGNVLDMAVGVIVGGAFTSIVNGMSNFILKPIINWILALCLGDNGLESAVTILSKAYMIGDDGKFVLDEAGNKIVDLANSIYIDWGSFISAIINFLLIAFVLFVIVRMINNISAAREKAIGEFSGNDKKEIKKIRKTEKVSWKEAKELYEQRVAAEKAKAEEEARIAAEKEAAAAAEAEAKAMANTRLLEEIRDLLKQK